MPEARISRFAIASLITGMLFFIPLVTGMLALVFGMLALKIINSSNGLLLGKGIAKGGIVLGTLSMLGWSAVLFGNTVYVIEPTEEAVVFRDKHLSHTFGPGAHFVYPGKDRVIVYDLYEVHSGKTGVQKYILNNKKQFEMNVEFDWRICVPAEHADNFMIGPNPEGTEQALAGLVRDAIRAVLFEKQIDAVRNAGSESAYAAIQAKVIEKAKVYGVCLAEDHRGDQKAIRLSVPLN